LDKIEKAVLFAADAHFLQKRKHSFLPYVVHPIETMKRVADYGIVDEDIIVAAVLHDVIEDCEERYAKEILVQFGWRVEMIVKECTRDKKLKTEKEKYSYLQSFSQKSIESVIVKIADRFSNTMDFYRFEEKMEYASRYALLAFPIYRTFIERHLSADENVLPRKAAIKILGDLVDLNIIISEQYKGFSCFVGNGDSYVQEVLNGDDRNRLGDE